MQKTFIDILRDSVIAFRKSFWTVLGIYAAILAAGIICGFISAVSLGKQGIMLLSMMGATKTFDPNLLSGFLPQLITIGILGFLFLLFIYFVSFWTVLIIRNNFLIGQSLLKQSFKETFGKIFKLIFFGLIFLIGFVVFSVLLGILFKKLSLLFLFVLMFAIAPMLYTLFYGILCREGNFWEVVNDSWHLGMTNWFRIMGYFILFIICAIIVFSAGMFVSFYLMRGNVIVSQIFNIIFQYAYSLFGTCFATVFFLDLADIGLTETEEIDISTVEMQPEILQEK